MECIFDQGNSTTKFMHHSEECKLCNGLPYAIAEISCQKFP